MSTNWPYERVDCSPAVREALEDIWHELSQRRPFKWDFPEMYDTEPEEWDMMTNAWAEGIARAEKAGAKRMLERVLEQVERYKRLADIERHFGAGGDVPNVLAMVCENLVKELRKLEP